MINSHSPDMKNNLIILICFLVATVGAKAQTHLTPDDFEIKLSQSKKGQLIDVRTPQEYKDGHLKNAQNIDYKNQAFKDQISKLDKTKPVFVYCLAGGRSAVAAEILHENGFSEIYDMKGGYLKWTSAGKEVNAPAGLSSSAKGMSASDFKKLTSSDNLVLVDFYAPWCAPCVKMLPTIKKLTQEYKGRAKIETINYDQNKALAKEMGIDEIPAFLVYKNGKLVSRKSGLLEEADFRKLLEQ